MPIRRDIRCLYPSQWKKISSQVRFTRAGGHCEHCGRPHDARLHCLPDGRWYDEKTQTWRDGRNRSALWPDLIEMTESRITRVILAAAHLNHDPRDNRMRNLHALCQRCHLMHDRQHHRLQRWITYRGRYALGDLFLGPYEVLRISSSAAIAAAMASKSLAPGRASRPKAPGGRSTPVHHLSPWFGSSKRMPPVRPPEAQGRASPGA